ncbi:MAG: hypothetical protein OEU92_09380 [Alphaproteobacteria bacterium]|nr:hypothetical protein [Alphaproteobacteria bacterium]
MTSHKAIYAAIASLLTTVALSLAGVMPTNETLLSTDLQQLIENVAALAIMTVVPGVVAYWKRNFVK